MAAKPAKKATLQAPEPKILDTRRSVREIPHTPHPTIVVTADHIEDSKRRDSSHCMIAEAIRSAVPSATRIAVDLQTLRFTLLGKRLRYAYLTPRIAQKALVAYDQGEEIKPFAFRLNGQAHIIELPELTEARRARNEKNNKKRDLKAKRLVKQHKSRRSPPAPSGGAAPPLGRFARIRRYGLRFLDP